MNKRRIAIGVASIIIGIFLFTTIMQSINCGISHECLGMDSFLLFFYSGENNYKMMLEAMIVLTVFLIGAGFIASGVIQDD